MKRFIKTGLSLLQLMISGGLLYLLLRQIPLSKLAEQAQTFGAARLLLAFTLLMISFLLTTLNWWLLLRAVDVHVRYGQTLLAGLSGLFYSMLVPSAISGDVIRGLRLFQQESQPRRIFISVMVDRITGLVSFGIVLIVLTPVFWQQLPFTITGQLPLLGFGVVFGANRLSQWAQTKLTPYWTELRAIGLRWSMVALGITLVVHLLNAGVLWVLVQPFWPDVSLAYCLYITELLNIAILLPISVAGLGVRETLYVVMLSAISDSGAIVISLTQFGLLAILAVTGGLNELQLLLSQPSPEAHRLKSHETLSDQE